MGELQNSMRLGEVARELNVSTQTVMRMVSRGEFPAPVTLSKSNRRWLRSDVETYLRQKVERRDQGK
jgi:excisionase family DNA binding protein